MWVLCIARSTVMLALYNKGWQPWPSLMFATPSKVATWFHELQALQIGAARLQLVKLVLQLVYN